MQQPLSRRSSSSLRPEATRRPRLLIVNNLPSHYRTAPFAALCELWAARTGGEAHVAYQVRRDPQRRGEWFFTPDADIPFRHSFQSPNSRALKQMTLYPPRFGLGLLLRFRPTHILAAGWDTPLSVGCAAYARVMGTTAAFWVESNASTSQRRGMLASRLKRYVLDAGLGVVVPTERSLDLIHSITPKNFSVVQLPNPVALARLPETPANGKRMIFVGELSERKGFDTFLEACARGESEGWTGAAWGDDSAGLAAEAPPNCTVSPALPLALLLPQLRTTDIWTIPSRRDPAPLTYSEALALGVRVSVSESVAYSEHARGTIGAGIHKSSDAASLLRSAGDLLSAPRPDERAAEFVSQSTWAQAIVALLLAGKSHS